MKVDLQHVEKEKGLFTKTPLYGVALTVTFNEEENAIIQENKLDDDVIMRRSVPVDRSTNAYYDANFTMTIGTLLHGTDTYFFDTPRKAKEYADELKQTMPKLKEHIMKNAEIGEKSETFEL